MPMGNVDEPRSLPGPISVALLCGVHPIIIYRSTGDSFCPKMSGVPFLNLLPFLAEESNPVHGSVKSLFGMPPKGQPFSVLLAPGILADMEHQKTTLMVIEMIAPACDHQSNLLI